MATPERQGYWLVAADGGIFSFGDAGFYGSMGGGTLNAPIVGDRRHTERPRLLAGGADGGVFAFGDAGFHGSMGGVRPEQAGRGHRRRRRHRRVLAGGRRRRDLRLRHAPFYGSTGGVTLNKPSTAWPPPPTASGYWLVAADGGVFAFGDAAFHGSMGGVTLNAARSWAWPPTAPPVGTGWSAATAASSPSTHRSTARTDEGGPTGGGRHVAGVRQIARAAARDGRPAPPRRTSAASACGTLVPGTAASALPLLWLWLRAVPATAGAATAGTATITQPGQPTPLDSGGSATSYGVALPSGASCPGDTAHQGYHVYSYLVPEGRVTHRGQLQDAVYPSRWYGYIAYGAYYGAVNTAEGTGQVMTLPDQFTWTRFSSYLERPVPHGARTGHLGGRHRLRQHPRRGDQLLEHPDRLHQDRVRPGRLHLAGGGPPAGLPATPHAGVVGMALLVLAVLFGRPGRRPEPSPASREAGWHPPADPATADPSSGSPPDRGPGPRP